MSRSAFGWLTTLLIVLPGAAAQAGDPAKLSNKWRIECSGRAESNGWIQFRVTQDRGVGSEVTVEIAKGRSENGVARDIRDAFRKQLPAGRFDVEIDDGEDVLIENNFMQPHFAVELIASTVEHIRLDLERE